MAMNKKSHRGPGGRSDDGTGQPPAVANRRPAAPGSRGPVVEGNSPQPDGGPMKLPEQYKSIRGPGNVGKGAPQYQGPGAVVENPKGRE